MPPDPDPGHRLPAPAAPGPLLPYLLNALRPASRTRVKELLRRGRVRVNGAPATRHDHPLTPADRVTLARNDAAPAAGVPVAYADDAVVVIDKPPGLLSVATEGEKVDTAFARLRDDLARRNAGRPFVVHRLDRDTSGLLLFALTPDTRDRLQANWDAVSKTYLAVTEGVPHPPTGVVDNFLLEGRDLRVRAVRAGGEAKRAVSRYRVVGSRGGYGLVEVDLETGRKHQIRVHLEGLGCPVVGDSTYGARSNPAGRLGLHAWRLSFDHPVSGRRVEVESPLPDSLRRVVG